MAFSRSNRRRRMHMGRNFHRKSDMKDFAQRFKASPVTKILGVGVVGYFAYKWGRKFYDEHPEIGEFLRDNLETVEDKFREYRENFSDMSQ